MEPEELQKIRDYWFGDDCLGYSLPERIRRAVDDIGLLTAALEQAEIKGRNKRDKKIIVVEVSGGNVTDVQRVANYLVVDWDDKKVYRD